MVPPSPRELRYQGLPVSVHRGPFPGKLRWGQLLRAGLRSEGAARGQGCPLCLSLADLLQPGEDQAG